MSFLSDFEGRMASVFGAAPQGYTEPFSFKRLAKKAAREMERETYEIDGIDTAPALYTVLVSAQDDSLMRPLYEQITYEMAAYLSAEAQRKGYSFVGSPLVRFMVDPSLRSGKFAVFAENIDSRTLARLRDEEREFLSRNSSVGGAAAQINHGPRAAAAQSPSAAPRSAAQATPRAAAAQSPSAYPQPQVAPSPTATPRVSAYPQPQATPLQSVSGFGASAYQQPSTSDVGLDVMADDYALGPIAIASASESTPMPVVGSNVPLAAPVATASPRNAAQAQRSASAQGAQAVPGAPAAPSGRQSISSVPLVQPAAVRSVPASSVPTVSPTPAAQPAPVASVPAASATPAVSPAPAPAAVASVQTSSNSNATFILIERSTGRTFTGAAPSAVIGRERSQSDVVLRDPNVSRRHAELTFDGRDWHIRDLHSTNGTQVNDVDIKDCVLRDGDLITVGLINLEFRETSR